MIPFENETLLCYQSLRKLRNHSNFKSPQFSFSLLNCWLALSREKKPWLTWAAEFPVDTVYRPMGGYRAEPGTFQSSNFMCRVDLSVWTVQGQNSDKRLSDVLWVNLSVVWSCWIILQISSNVSSSLMIIFVYCCICNGMKSFVRAQDHNWADC